MYESLMIHNERDRMKRINIKKIHSPLLTQLFDYPKNKYKKNENWMLVEHAVYVLDADGIFISKKNTAETARHTN
jgi:hypothetical protein